VSDPGFSKRRGRRRLQIAVRRHVVAIIPGDTDARQGFVYHMATDAPDL
jgi:hypothetical protein